MQHCNNCERRPFRTIAALRRHQWAAHPELYVNTGTRKKSLELMKLEPVPEIKQEMSAAQLLDKLKLQRNFMNDVVALVEGVIKR